MKHKISRYKIIEFIKQKIEKFWFEYESFNTQEFVNELQQGRLDFSRSLLMVDLAGFDLRDINISNSIAHYCNFSHTNLTNGNLSNVSFIGTNLSHANLCYSNCNNTNFSKTNLSWSVLRNVNFENSDFTEASLIGADLKGSKILEEAKNVSLAELSCSRFNGSTVKGTQTLLQKTETLLLS